ncbi:MAG: hypothetical protein ACK4MY_15505, partial [Brevundimonas sp.]
MEIALRQTPFRLRDLSRRHFDLFRPSHRPTMPPVVTPRMKKGPDVAVRAFSLSPILADQAVSSSSDFAGTPPAVLMSNSILTAV